jgi:hypothetical protein
MKERKVCVFCASSGKCDAAYLGAARRLGAHLARHGVTLVYGGGGAGGMKSLADGALAAGGKVIGIIPRFMYELEWGHPHLTELRVVEDMHERKRQMVEGADAIVSLPGGCGTLEELFETMTLKRVGQFLNPIILVNTRGFYDRVVAALDHCIGESFMDSRHRDMWTLVNEPEEVMAAIGAAPRWQVENRDFAVMKPTPKDGHR